MIPEEDIPFSYDVSKELAGYGKAVIETWPEEFEFLGESNIAFLFTNQPITLRGSIKAAVAMIPNVKGQEANIFWWAVTTALGFTPDVFIIVDKAEWDAMAENKDARVILLHHECLHVVHKSSEKSGPSFNAETNRPNIKLREHQVESFYLEAERFGAWNGRLKDFMALMQSKEDKFKELHKVVALAESYAN